MLRLFTFPFATIPLATAVLLLGTFSAHAECAGGSLGQESYACNSASEVEQQGTAQLVAELTDGVGWNRPYHTGRFFWWRAERARRQAEIDAYIADNRDAFESFRTAPLAIKQGPLNFVGMSTIGAGHVS